MPGRIFISYRRGDEPGFALALYTRLEHAFSAEQLFMDVEGGIAAGHDFAQVLETQIAQCDVLLVLIGQGWLGAADEMGSRRLDSLEDFVRFEIESAMRLGKRVIPVLINKTEMPRAAELPSALQALTRRNAVRLTQDRFRADVEGLVAAIKGALAEAQAARDAEKRAAAEARLRQQQEEAAKGKEAARPHSKRFTAQTRRRLLLGAGGAVGTATVGVAVIWAFSPRRPTTIPLIRTFTGHTKSVNSVAFSPDGLTALSGSGTEYEKPPDNTLRLWDVGTGAEIRTFAGHSAGVTSVTFSPDGRQALSGSLDYTLKLWELATGKDLRTFTGHRGSVQSVAFSSDGRTVLSGSIDKTLKLWEASTGKLLRTIGPLPDWVSSVAFSSDGRTALSGGQFITLWDLATGRDLRTFGPRDNHVNSVQFSPDGRTVLSSGGETAKLWELATGKELRTFSADRYNVTSVAFSPDGRLALTAGGALTLWEVATGRALYVFLGQYPINSVAFSPNGRLALAGSTDTLKLWDLTGW